jgi:type II secretory pathway pseudopilin PulG
MSANRKAAGPPPERKAPTGPVVTPGMLSVGFVIIIIIAVVAYFQTFVKDQTAKQQAATARASSAEANIKTYTTKGNKLAIAETLNVTVKEKLKDTAYMFMTDQSTVIPFWQETFLPILSSSNLYPGEDAKIDADDYVFQLNMAMNPFGTLPSSQFFENAEQDFGIAYLPEQGGVPIEEPVATMQSDFLTPYNIELTGWRGSYQDVQRFVRHLQLRQNKTLFTVHCFKNKEDKNVYGYRTDAEWDIQLTVYFINPEAQASGDAPPGLPGESSC